MRQRSKDPRTASYYSATQGFQFSVDYHAEHMWESNYPGSCSVRHYRLTPMATWYNSPKSHFWVGFIPPLVHPKDPKNLNWGKLPTSTEVGLIQLLAEIDDTIMVFTRKFWQSLTYGSFTWGVVPFVSDLVATATAVRNLSKDLSRFQYEDEFAETQTRNNLLLAPDTYCDLVQEVKWRRTGLGDLSFHHPGSLALDRLGFHPDLATTWDLVPLSFLVDYLLPIGDYLESFRQGGWVKTMYFTGWTTCHCFTLGHIWNQSGSTINWPKQPFSTTAFYRYGGSDVLVVPAKQQAPDFRMPSLRQMFDMLYVFTGGKVVSFRK